jgi:hypothetical protein
MSIKKPFRAVPVRPVERYRSQPQRSRASLPLLVAAGLGIGGGFGLVLIEKPSAPVAEAPANDSTAQPLLRQRAPQQFMPAPVQTVEDLDREQPTVTSRVQERPVARIAQPTTGPTWSYPNCRAARAAGAAPLYAGQPGYGAHMDGDGDGIACEPYHGAR